MLQGQCPTLVLALFPSEPVSLGVSKVDQKFSPKRVERSRLT